MARDLARSAACRREGMKLFLKGERCLTEKCAIERRSYLPGEWPRPHQATGVPSCSCARSRRPAAGTTACSRSSSAPTTRRRPARRGSRARTCSGCSRRASTTSSTAWVRRLARAGLLRAPRPLPGERAPREHPATRSNPTTSSRSQPGRQRSRSSATRPTSPPLCRRGCRPTTRA